MKQPGAKYSAMVLVAVMLILTLSIPTVHAQSGGGYSIRWSTFASGGGASTAGVYTLSSTMGQPGAGMLIGSGYHLQGGFWASFEKAAVRIFLPLIRR